MRQHLKVHSAIFDLTYGFSIGIFQHKYLDKDVYLQYKNVNKNIW